MTKSQSSSDIGWWEEWHESLLTATNSSEAANRLWITYQAPSWMACTHLTWAGVAQCDRPALHLPATLSLGTGWMTYSLCEVFEPVRGESQWPRETRRNHLHKTVQDEKWVFRLPRLQLRPQQHRSLNTKVCIQSLIMHNGCHRQTTLSRESYID